MKTTRKTRESKTRRMIQLRRDRKARIEMHNETLKLLRAMLADAEKQQDAAEIRRLSNRIRTTEQQIRYMGGEA